MEILLQLIYSGIALGMIYAVIAFGYQLTFATSDTLNFGQGEALMLGALVGLTLVDGLGVNYWLAIPVVGAFGLLQGALVERIGVRPAIKIKSEFGWIMSTIALGIIFKNVAENVWGRDDLKFPSPLPEMPMKVLGANVLPMELLVIAGALVMMLAVEFFNRKTIYGKAVVATFNDRDAAKLMGINLNRVITTTFLVGGLATGAAAFFYITVFEYTKFNIGFTMGLAAFTAAVIGGIGNIRGAFFGGVALGLAEVYVSSILGTQWKSVTVFIILVLILLFKPSGLFGEAITQARA